MSAAEPATSAPAGGARKSSNRKRSSKPRGPRPEGEAGADAEPRAPREKKERVPDVPLPESLIGTVAFGRVSDVIARGRDRFGFIFVTPENHVPGPDDHKNQFQGFVHFPRIYFNNSEWKEENSKIRKNDLITFTPQKDDKDRPFASSITLTPAGREEAAKRDAAFAAQAKELAERPPREPRAASEKGPAKRRERKERVVDERTVNLNMTCVDFPGVSKEITAVLGESIGKLKHTGITVFEGARVELKVFYKNELLTRAILLTLAEGETLHLGEDVAAN